MGINWGSISTVYRFSLFDKKSYIWVVLRNIMLRANKTSIKIFILVSTCLNLVESLLYQKWLFCRNKMSVSVGNWNLKVYSTQQYIYAPIWLGEVSSCILLFELTHHIKDESALIWLALIHNIHSTALVFYYFKLILTISPLDTVNKIL